MTKFEAICFGIAAAILGVSSAQAATKVDAACFYESGQNGNQTISDFTILNTASFPIPKGTLVTFTSSGAPGKTFTTRPSANIAPQDSFSSGGIIPIGSCSASWLK